MKPVSENVLDQAEELAIAGMKATKEFLAYAGSDMRYYHRAKVGVVAMGNFVRLRATETNRQMVELASRRADTKTLPG